MLVDNPLQRFSPLLHRMGVSEDRVGAIRSSPIQSLPRFVRASALGGGHIILQQHCCYYPKTAISGLCRVSFPRARSTVTGVVYFIAIKDKVSERTVVVVEL